MKTIEAVRCNRCKKLIEHSDNNKYVVFDFHVKEKDDNVNFDDIVLCADCLFNYCNFVFSLLERHYKENEEKQNKQTKAKRSWIKKLFDEIQIT